MSVKNNAILAGSWLLFVLIFFGGLLGLFVIILLISRSGDSNNDKSIQLKSANPDVVKSIPTTGCGCGKNKVSQEEKKKRA